MLCRKKADLSTSPVSLSRYGSGRMTAGLIQNFPTAELAGERDTHSIHIEQIGDDTAWRKTF
jgi:hypothetical protein